jgi:hypothetical protein
VATRRFHTPKIAGSIPALATTLCVLALVACAQQPVRSVPVALPLPTRPVLAPVPAASVQCLAPETYTTLVNRERALKTWGLQLEAIIKANNTHTGGK